MNKKLILGITGLESIKFGYEDYKLFFKPESEMRDSLGLITHLEEKIEILDDLKVKQKEVSTLHEITHMILESKGINGAFRMEGNGGYQEILAEAVSTGLYEILQRNDLKIIKQED